MRSSACLSGGAETTVSCGATFRHIAKMFNISSGTIEQLRLVLFPHIPCVRVRESYPQPEYATDLLESDVDIPTNLL
jgi:hypothetical protein